MVFIKVFALLLIIASFWIIFRDWKFYKKQKKKCNTYPFYKLRGEIVSNIILTGDYDKYKGIYEISNDIISHLKKFNFRSFTYALDNFLMNFLEKKYKGIDHKKPEMCKYSKQLAKLIMVQAKKNSLLLRITLSDLGFYIIIPIITFKVFLRFIDRHPDLLERKRTAVGYSEVNRKLQFV